jgi:hypothetical protein
MELRKPLTTAPSSPALVMVLIASSISGVTTAK